MAKSSVVISFHLEAYRAFLIKYQSQQLGETRPNVFSNPTIISTTLDIQVMGTYKPPQNYDFSCVYIKHLRMETVSLKKNIESCFLQFVAPMSRNLSKEDCVLVLYLLLESQSPFLF